MRNPEKNRASKRAWEKRNPEYMRAKTRRHHRAHRAELRAYEMMDYYRNPDGRKRRNRERRRLSRYGMTHAQYLTKYRQQGGKCAICQRPGPPGGRTYDALVVDHDHKSGKVRELVCRRCNVGLGCFRDDTLWVASALQYLERHKASEERV